MMNINSTAAFLLCQACCPAMAEKGWGRVVNITSWAWKSGGLTAGTAYAASKGAMTSLTFSVALQYAKQGITCNGIAPCYVMSPMITEQLTEEERQGLLAKIPVGKFCLPEEVAHTTEFLVSKPPCGVHHWRNHRPERRIPDGLKEGRSRLAKLLHSWPMHPFAAFTSAVVR